MNCLEFRRLVGAQPEQGARLAARHAADCPACAQFARRMSALDAKLLRALEFPVPPQHGEPHHAQEISAAYRRAGRRYARSASRWLAVAASVVAGIGIAATMWLLFPRATLAADVLAHLAHEPHAWAASAPAVQPPTLRAILKRAELDPELELGVVSYAQSCWFRGHFVPHLVVQDEHGPVTVMLLPREEVAGETHFFSEGGYSGVILPAGAGSLAVVTLDPKHTRPAALRIRRTLLGD